MKAANGGSYGEFVVLRALKAKGGDAAFSELSAIRLKGIERILLGMLPPQSRPKGIPSKKTMRGSIRPPLVRRYFVGNALHYKLTPAGWRGANHPGPWTIQIGDVILEWNSAMAEVFEMTNRVQIASFSPERVFIEVNGTFKDDPGVEDWKAFQEAIFRFYRLRVPYEAMPDRLRWPPGFADCGQKNGPLVAAQV